MTHWKERIYCMSVRKLGRFVEEEGDLFPIEFKNLPFVPKRIFYVTNVPAGQTRGLHAHYETEQILICVKGRLGVTLDNGRTKSIHELHEGEFVYVGKLIWDSQKYRTGDDIMLSICSTPYDPKDYITNHQEFLSIVMKL